MAEPKTARNKSSVVAFVRDVADPKRRKDCRTVMKLMRAASGRQPRMWGTSIVGYGAYTVANTTGKPQQWMLTGVSPRKNELTLYIMNGFDRYRPLLAKLGRHRTGRTCLYLKSLEDVDMPTLQKLIERSIADMKRAYEVE